MCHFVNLDYAIQSHLHVTPNMPSMPSSLTSNHFTSLISQKINVDSHMVEFFDNNDY